VVTPDEIAAVELFSDLDEAERERLSRVAADIRLVPGEYAVHAGEERALYAVLDGRLETVSLVDGVEEVVGGRSAGELFGEVPIALGTTFPFGFRAAEVCRVIRVKAQDYHAVAARAPAVAEKLGVLARARIGGLQSITAEAPPPRAVVFGRRHDPDFAELRRFLDRNQITHRWVADDAPDAGELWGGPPPAAGESPVIRLVDGHTAARPSHREVAELLGLATRPGGTGYDVLIVGAGPAGLAAAVYGASEGLSTIVVEREAPGGQAGTSSRIENYLGFPSGVSGDELASRALQQVRRLGAELLVTRAITRLDPVSRLVELDGGDVLEARAIILACGVSWRHLTVDGFERLVGKGISYGAARSEAPNAHGLDVHIVGAGNSAGQAALFFANHARTVTILCRSGSLRKSMSRYLIDQLVTRPNIGVLFGAEVVGVVGDSSLEAIDVHEAATGETSRLESGGLFVFIGADAETAWLPAEIALDRHGYVLTGAEAAATGRWELDRDPYLLETTVPGIFACGDVRSGPVKRVAAAVGEGSMATSFVHAYLKTLAPVPELPRV
jgi:thioredoxin reductase (NADPH)